jgi:uncharacterized protein YndB with AHSA1/START domain
MAVRRMRASGRRRIEASIEIEASVEAVWKALTDAEELTRWFPLQARVQPNVGGSIWLSWGPPYEGEARIEVWDPYRRLRTTDQGFGNSDVVGAPRRPAEGVMGSGESQPAKAQASLDYQLEGRPGKTTLHLVHSGFGQDNDWDEEFDSVRRGWQHELRSLRHYLERHRGTPRLAIWPRVPLPPGGSVMQAWERLTSRDALLRQGTIAGLREGARYDIRTAAGDDLRGTVLINQPPDFTGTVDNLNDGLFRIHIEASQGIREAGLWLSTYGVPAAQVEAIETGWAEMLRALFVPKAPTAQKAAP